MRDFKATKTNRNTQWYDLEYDQTLIEQSIAKQYGIIPSKQPDLHYADWVKLVSGLMDDTPLGRVVAVRSEDNPDVLKGFTPAQHRIRSEWRDFQTKRQAQTMSMDDWLRQMAELERQLAAAFS